MEKDRPCDFRTKSPEWAKDMVKGLGPRLVIPDNLPKNGDYQPKQATGATAGTVAGSSRLLRIFSRAFTRSFSNRGLLDAGIPAFTFLTRLRVHRSSRVRTHAVRTDPMRISA